MYYEILFLLLSFILTCIYVLITLSGRRKSGTAQLPPGPYPFPVIGSILKLGDRPHESLATLSETYGPLMSLKLGSTTTIVVSSPKIAKELLQKNDQASSGRSVPHAVHSADHCKFSVVWLPAGSQWRKLKRLYREQLFALQRLESSQLLRGRKVQELLDHAHQCCINGEAVDIGRATFTTTVNSISNFTFSIDLVHFDSLSSQEFKETISALLEIVGKPNLADFFPVLKMIDPQGVLQEANVYAGKILLMFEQIVNQRLQARASTGDASSRRNDVLDLMLDLTQKNDSQFSLNDILHVFFDLFVAGVPATSRTMEWAMAELLRNPEKMAKCRCELEEVIGKDKNRLVQESDISKLPYLQAIVKETLRLHPPLPLLIPHKAESDIEVQGFMVPKDAQILTNVWAIGRDPSVWLNPMMFVPERFLDCELDFRGQDFELIPFGTGRRSCPGFPLAYRMVHLILGSLIYSFDWKLEGEMKAEDMDMSEKFGITIQKAIPLKAIPIRL